MSGTFWAGTNHATYWTYNSATKTSTYTETHNFTGYAGTYLATLHGNATYVKTRVSVDCPA